MNLNYKLRRFLLILMVTISFVILGNSNLFLLKSSAIAQSTEELYYTFFDQKIPLVKKQDTMAVVFTEEATNTTRSSSEPPLYIQLQQELNNSTRGENEGITIEVTPLSSNYALVNLNEENTEQLAQLEANIRKQSYVQTTLPVLTQSQSTFTSNSTMILPNEILISFQEGLSEREKLAILAQQNLELIYPIEYTDNLYLVRSTIAEGTAILGVVNQLNQVPNIQSASPNFIQNALQQNSLNSPNLTSLESLQWHLDSSTLQSCFAQFAPNNPSFRDLENCSHQTENQRKNLTSRTDIYAPEAWQNNDQGQGVKVAVIDTLIQWDHQNLSQSVHNLSEKGWDFVENDNDRNVESRNKT